MNGVLGPYVDTNQTGNNTEFAQAVMCVGGKSGEAYIHYVVCPDCSSNVAARNQVFVATDEARFAAVVSHNLRGLCRARRPTRLAPLAHECAQDRPLITETKRRIYAGNEP